jgi:hypothetical protein
MTSIADTAFPHFWQNRFSFVTASISFYIYAAPYPTIMSALPEIECLGQFGLLQQIIMGLIT